MNLDECLKDVSDGELIMLYREDDEEAKNLLYYKYKFIINILMNKYRFQLNKMNVDYQEIYSECLVGFSDAIKNFQEEKEASLPTFITLCVERKIKGYIKKYNRPKYKELNESYSLDIVLDDNNNSLIDLISDENAHDPLKNIMDEEDYKELVKKIKAKLTSNEYEVFLLLYKGMTLNEISKILNKSYKQIDNTIQRVKNKIKKMI